MKLRILLLVFAVNYCSGMDLSRQGNSQQIIVLNGTTTAGKTSTALQLAQLLESQSLPVKILSIDDFVVPKVQRLVFKQRINPWNMFVANEDLIQKSHMKQIKKESMAELCAAAICLYKQNNIVIIDAPIYKNQHIDFYKEQFKDFDISDVSWVLAYCPITTLVKRVIERNEKSSILGQRSILQAIYQFSYFYHSSPSELNDSIDQLSREDFDNMSNNAEEEHAVTQEMIPDFLKGVQSAICPSKFGVIKDVMFRKLLFTPDNIASISPTIAHDCIINTEQYASAACAEKILNFLIKN